MKHNREIVLMLLLVCVGLVGAERSQGATSVTNTVPTEKYAAFTVPDHGAALTLTLKSDPGCTLDSSQIVPADTCDKTIWTPASSTGPGPHIYQSVLVISSREWLRINGKFKGGGSGVAVGADGLQTFEVDVPGVDIKMDGVLEENEETPGGYVGVGTNCMQRVTINQVQSKNRFSGIVKFEATGVGSKIRLWSNKVRTNEITTFPKEYLTPSGLPQEIWVEGIAASSATNDVELKVSYTTPTENKTAEDKVKLTVLKVEMTKPTIDAKVEYDSSSPGKLEIAFEATVAPDSAETRAFLAGKVKFEVDAIGSSVLSWDNPGGIGVYNSGVFKNKATFTGLPANNSDFGEKKVRLRVTDCSGCDSERTNKIFYTATANNHPGGVATDPNWFCYYKNEEGGTDYTYDSTLSTSQSTPSVPNSIRIANNAYSGSTYIQTAIVGGKRKASGVSSTIKYWKYFSGVVVHERFHVSNGSNHGVALDPDADDLKTSVETGTVSSDANDKYSIDGGVFGNSVWDDECWAGGNIEKSGIDAAATINDWAHPGLQWP